MHATTEAVVRRLFMGPIEKSKKGKLLRRIVFHSRNDVEVSEEARCYGVPSTPGWAARAHEHHVDDLPELQSFAVVPFHTL